VHADDPGDLTGAVLVTQVLAPTLAPRVPGLAGLVSETGSSLSHLAIVAREHSVPTVVAVDGALERFPAGSHVLVDGTTGEVRRLDDERKGRP
jgi:pyruvate,water dikinase